jgi:hypothetical protein
MAEQIVVTLDDDSDLSKEEWKEFVRSRRGKWRGVASEEAVKALLRYIDEKESESVGNDSEKRRLLQENERLNNENERLLEEIQRLQESMPTPSESRRQTKKNTHEQTKKTTDSGSAGDYVDWWNSYDHNPERDVTIPRDAIKQLPECKTVPPIHIQHIDPCSSVPYKGKEAKRALLRGVLKTRFSTVTKRDVLDLATKLFSTAAAEDDEREWPDEVDENDVDAYHYRTEWVEPTLANLPEHPVKDDEWCVSEFIYEKLKEELQTQRERKAAGVIGAALGDTVEMEMDDYEAPTTKRHLKFWEDNEEEMKDLLAEPPVWAITRDALEQIEKESPDFKTDLGEFISWMDEWPSTPRELVRWWAADIANKDEIVECLKDLYGEERRHGVEEVPDTADDELEPHEEVSEEIEKLSNNADNAEEHKNKREAVEKVNNKSELTVAEKRKIVEKQRSG